MRRYRTVFNREALEFVVQTDDEVFREIEQWVNGIERAPATGGDYSEQDNDGRELEVVLLGAVVIAYWIDDAVQEVRVVRIEAL